MVVLKRFLLIVLIGFSLSLFAAEPPVKKSKNGICHPKGGTYYDRTKNYMPYESMADCIKSGGRKPKK
jgi:hypothetical protein